MKDSRTVRTFVRNVNSVCFGGDIRARRLKRKHWRFMGPGLLYRRAQLPFAISKENSSKDYVCLTVFRLN